MLRIAAGKNRIAFVRGAPCGFFGNMFMTLNGLRLCEVAGVTGRPLWGRESLYFERQHGENVWEYYFEKSDNKEDDLRARASGDVFVFKPDAMDIENYYPGLDSRQTYRLVIEKYVHLKQDLLEDIDTIANAYFLGERVLGVHCRLTDNYRGYESRYPHSVDEYLVCTDECLDAYGLNRIFLASDSNHALRIFRKRYGKRVIALEGIRSDDYTSVHGHYDKGVAASGYRKGFEVIRDAYLLSKACHLIGAPSKVTKFSLSLNGELDLTEVC